MSFSLIIFSNLSSDFFEFHPPLFTTLNIYNYIIIIHPEEEEEGGRGIIAVPPQLLLFPYNNVNKLLNKSASTFHPVFPFLITLPKMGWKKGKRGRNFPYFYLCL